MQGSSSSTKSRHQLSTLMKWKLTIINNLRLTHLKPERSIRMLCSCKMCKIWGLSSWQHH